MGRQQLVRGGFLGAGLGLGLFGTWSLLRLGISNLFWAVVWLAGGVIGHDGLITAASLALLTVGLRALPSWTRKPVGVGFVVVATVTVMAIPVLGSFGARPDNPSLLDRSYGVGWLVFAGIVVFCVAAGCLAARRRELAAASVGHG